MRLIYLALTFFVFVLFSMGSLATTITTDFDSSYGTIETKPCPGSCSDNTLVHNGLTIIDNGGTTNTAVGDGIDETWKWSFDFGSDPNATLIPQPGQSDRLISALLELVLIPKDSLVNTDGFSLANLTPFGGCYPQCDPFDRVIFDLPLNIETTLTIDLLTGDYSGSNALNTEYFGTLGDLIYTKDEIIDSINSGMIAAEFGDDAIIERATLSLSVPEPPSLLLFGVALIFMIGVAKKDQWGHIRTPPNNQQQ
jgi:hypothetical protein